MLEGPSKDTDLVWEACLEGMAPEIDGKVYVTEFEGVNDAERFARARHAGNHRSDPEAKGLPIFIGRAIKFSRRSRWATCRRPVLIPRADAKNLSPILSSP